MIYLDTNVGAWLYAGKELRYFGDLVVLSTQCLRKGIVVTLNL